MTYASSRYEGQGITISYNELSDCPITCMYKNMYMTQQTNTFKKNLAKLALSWRYFSVIIIIRKFGLFLLLLLALLLYENTVTRVLTGRNSIGRSRRINGSECS